MDKDRQIRFLYPPFILTFSLLIGLFFDDTNDIKKLLEDLGLSDDVYKEFFTILVGGAISIFVIGFVIGTISVNLLRLFRWNIHFDGFNLKDTTFQNPKLTPRNKKSLSKENEFYAIVTIDHKLVDSRIHEWIVRRWNSFMVSINSIVAILLSVIVGLCVLEIKFSWGWILFCAIFSILLLINGMISRKEVIEMLDYQSEIDFVEKVPSQID